MSLTLRATVGAVAQPALVVITPLLPSGSPLELRAVQSWELDSQADPTQIVFSHQGFQDWPDLEALLSAARTVQQDMVWTNERPHRVIAREPKVVTLEWYEHLAGSAMPDTPRSATGVLEMLAGSYNVGGTVTRSLKFWRADRVYAYNNPAALWSAP